MTQMPDLVAQTRIFAKRKRALNNMSMSALKRLQEELRAGERWGDIMLKQRGPQAQTKEDLDHLLNHVFNRDGTGWWGPNLEDLYTEAMAQVLQRMMFTIPDCEGRSLPREARKPVDMYWLCPSTFYFSVVITESEQQLTVLIIAPPKADKPGYAEYLKRRAANKVPFPIQLVPERYDRLEDIWVITQTPYSVTTGKNANGDLVPLAQVIQKITNVEGVTVTRLFSEPFADQFVQGDSEVELV